MSTTMSGSWKVLFLMFLVPIVALAAWLAYHETRTPQNENEVLRRMIELQREGRYDKAVQVVQNWMNDSRRDMSHDELLYQQIAMVYIAKAYKKRSSRDESVHLAEMNLEKSLNLFEKDAPKDNDPWLFEIGGAYELLGDTSDKDKCRLYEKASAALTRQLPLIKGDSYTAYGHTTPLEPVRAEIRKHLDALNEKSSKAGCPVQ
jgi:tetratricopeptide (TPR) repeat protein